MGKYLFVPYFCHTDYKNEAIKNAKNEEEKTKIERTYGIYRRWICRPAANGAIDRYLLEGNPITAKEGDDICNLILRNLSNRRVNVWVDEPAAASKKETKKIEELVEMKPVEEAETHTEAEPAIDEPTTASGSEMDIIEEPIEEAPKATPKKKKSKK